MGWMTIPAQPPMTTLRSETAHAQEVKVIVSNPSTLMRHEVVEADVADVRRQLGVADSVPLMVLGAFGQQVDCQVTYDGRLLIEASVLPNDKADFTVLPGTPREARHYVQGAQYRQRLDDLTWENDRCAYRLYGPALQRKGERSFGIDVWTKSTPELVVARRYRLHLEGNSRADSLHRQGRKDEAATVRQETSFHIDHGDGMDGYGVGPTLGCGAPALVIDGQMQMPWCYESYRILDNGPLRFTVELTYPKTAAGITEHRRIQLDKGSHFNRMTVWYDGIMQPVTLTAGVVLHGGEPVLGKDYVLYADPTEKPRQYQSQIFVGALFPEGVDSTCTMENADKKPHAVGVVSNYQGQPYTYWFGAGWSHYDVASMDIWQLYALDFLNALRQPLIIKTE